MKPLCLSLVMLAFALTTSCVVVDDDDYDDLPVRTVGYIDNDYDDYDDDDDDDDGVRYRRTVVHMPSAHVRYAY
jgi:hypothetical protein